MLWSCDSQSSGSGSGSSESKADKGTGGQLAATTVDCAHGVGAVALKAVASRLEGVFPIALRNTGGGGGKLNHNAGAEHVQKSK